MKTFAAGILSLTLAAVLAAQSPASPARLFAVHFTTGPAWDATKPPNEQPLFKEHSANLNRMRQAGLLVLGGRYGEFGLILVRAPDEAAVQAQLAQDPSLAVGLFKAQVSEFRPFMHGSTEPPASSPEIDVVRKQLEAFNRHSPDDVVACYAENIKWLSIDGDNVSTEGDGRESIRAWLKGYFESLPTVKSELLEINQTGPHVVFRERPSWIDKAGQPRSQTAIGVFEVRDGLVRRAWYFPVVAAKPAAK